MDNWAACDAEAVVTALSVRYRFSRANALQLLRDQGILPQRKAEEDDVEEAEDWESDEEDEEEEEAVEQFLSFTFILAYDMSLHNC